MRHVPGVPKRLAIIGCGVQGRRHLEVALQVHPGLTHVTAYDYVDGVAEQLLKTAGDRVTAVANTPTEAVAGADLVITTITAALDPKLDCANTDTDALLLPVDYRYAMSVAAFEDAAVYCVDDRGQYDYVADRLYFFGLPKPQT
ncbi:MAG: hypothetical protein L0H24_00110 [Microlunatus sp.]|nr:hypothetical protein [Microlunatus sp.]